MSAISILLAEDHTIVREGLRALLESESDIKIIGEAGDGRKIVKLSAKLRPDVIVMDIAMPLMNGIEATRQILHQQPEAKILILSAHSDDAYVEQIIALGAKGYLIKQTAAHVLAESIRRVHHGETCLSPVISKRLHHHETKAQINGELHPKKNASQLSSREAEVLQLIAEGKANKETADVLKISIKTVEKVIVIDGPAGLGEVTRSMLLVADVALIPCGPSVLDLRAASDAVRVLDQVHRIRGEKPKGAFIPNKLQKNYRLSEELLITAKTLGLDVTPGLGLRQAFADSAGQKSVVWRMNRQAEPAATEILGLFDHLFAN